MAEKVPDALSSDTEARRVAEQFAPFVRDSPPFSLPEKALTFLVASSSSSLLSLQVLEGP